MFVCLTSGANSRFNASLRLTLLVRFQFGQFRIVRLRLICKSNLKSKIGWRVIAKLHGCIERIVCILLISIMFPCAAGNASAFSSDSNAASTIGPLTPSPAVTLYWLNRPSRCNANLRLISRLGETALVRAYLQSMSADGPVEQLLVKHRLTLPPSAGGDIVKTLSLNIPDTVPPRSVVEIRVSSGNGRLTATLIPSCRVPLGNVAVSFQNGIFTPWTSNATEPLYAYIPYASEALHLKLLSAQTSLLVRGISLKQGRVVNADAIGPHGGPTRIDSPHIASLIPKQQSWPGTGHSDVVWKFEFNQTPLAICRGRNAINSWHRSNSRQPTCK